MRGRVVVPPSKSATHRALVLALVADAPSRIERPLAAEDTRLAAAALRACGARVEVTPAGLAVTPGAPLPAASEVAIDCGAAGTMLRFLVAVLATRSGCFVLDGVPRLRERPLAPLLAALAPLGVRIDALGRPGHVPLRVHGGTLRGGRTTLDAGESSQYLSALLLAGLRAREPVEIVVSRLTSAPYVELTLEAIAAAGGVVERPGPGVYRVLPAARLDVARLVVEGDWSAAAYPAAAAAVTAGEVRLAGLRADSRQGDRRLVELLAAMGARVSWEDGGDGRELLVAGAPLVALDADLGDVPDQVPTFAALAPFARGTTRIRGVPHLRLKESDRLAAMARELGRLGVPVREHPDGLEVDGVWAAAAPPSAPVVCDPHDDHRIAMSLAVVGLRRPGVAVAHPHVVGKSYPGFWDDLDRLLG